MCVCMFLKEDSIFFLNRLNVDRPNSCVSVTSAQLKPSLTLCLVFLFSAELC